MRSTYLNSKVKINTGLLQINIELKESNADFIKIKESKQRRQ